MATSKHDVGRSDRHKGRLGCALCQRCLVGALVFTLGLLGSNTSEAQRSGGRFGGSSGFRSSSSSSSYRSSSSSSSYRSSSSSSSWGSSSSRSSYGSTYTPPPPPPPPPPWLTAVQYRRPSPMSATSYVNVGTIIPLSEDERLFEQQRTNPGQLRHGPYSFGGAAVGFAFGFGPLAALSYLLTRPPAPYSPNAPSQPYSNNGYAPMGANTSAGGDCEVRRVSLAFDSRIRKSLQESLDQIASNVDMSSPQGLWRGADQARQLLLQALHNVSAACFASYKSSAQGAEQLFARTCDDLNGRYEQATISNHRRNEPPDVTARREEGDGFVVVSIVVGINGNLQPLPNSGMRESVREVLRGLLPSNMEDLASLEVVWSPSIDQDRLSSAEMAVLYPELRPMDGAVAMGRVRCTACKNVYAKELGACPICGGTESISSELSAKQQAQISQGASASHMINCPYCAKPTPSYEVQCQHCGGRVKT